MDIITILLFGIIILLTHFMEALIGFGGTVLALPFAILLVGIKVTKPILTIVSLISCIYVVFVSYKDISWKDFFKIIGFMAIGFPIGILCFNMLPESTLKKILGVFMIAISTKGLMEIYNPKKKKINLSNKLLNMLLILGGCVHGSFSCGGPIIITYASEKMPNKDAFRSTLCALWIVLNSIIAVQSALTGDLTPESLKLLLYSTPFLMVGTVLGNIAHKKIDGAKFSKLVYIILLISSIFMFI